MQMVNQTRKARGGAVVGSIGDEHGCEDRDDNSVGGESGDGYAGEPAQAPGVRSHEASEPGKARLHPQQQRGMQH